MIARRSIIKGLVALVAAPAIIKVADLMPVNAKLWPGFDFSGLQRYDGVSLREVAEYVPGAQAVQLDVLYGEITLDAFTGRILQPMMDKLTKQVVEDIIYGSSVQRTWFDLTDVQVSDPVRLRYNKERRSIDVIPQVPDNLALAAAAVAVAPMVLAKPVTRRFWAR